MHHGRRHHQQHPAAVAVSAKDVSVAAQVYRPTLLVGEISGPLAVAEPGQPPRFVANWTRARGSVSGLPPEPDSVSVTLDHPHVDQMAGANATTLFAADHAEFLGRIVGGSAANNPVIDALVKFAAATRRRCIRCSPSRCKAKSNRVPRFQASGA